MIGVIPLYRKVPPEDSWPRDAGQDPSHGWEAKTRTTRRSRFGLGWTEAWRSTWHSRSCRERDRSFGWRGCLHLDEFPAGEEVGPAVHLGRLDPELGQDRGHLAAVLGAMVDRLEQDQRRGHP